MKKIPVIFHNCSKCDYRFKIKELAKEFKGQFEWLGENTENYIAFSESINKELKNNKTSTYKIKFIDRKRFYVKLIIKYCP